MLISPSSDVEFPIDANNSAKYHLLHIPVKFTNIGNERTADRTLKIIADLVL